MAANLKLESCVGAPLRDGEGKVIGVLTTAYCHSLSEIDAPSALVELFAQQAVMLLERDASADTAAFFRSLLDHSHEGVLVLDPESGRILEANEPAAELLGYSQAELRERSITHLDQTLRSDSDLAAWLRQSAAPEGLSDESIYHRKDGGMRSVEINARWVEINARPHLLVGVRDASVRHHAEETLRESEQRFRALVENSSDVVTMLDADGRILYISPSVRHVFGHQPGDLLGECFFNRLNDSQRADFEDCFRKWAATPQENWSKYFEWPDADGATRHIAARICNLLLDPAVQAIVINMRDVTERIRATAQMRRQADLINQADEAICVWDLQGNVRSWNRGAERLYGYNFPEVFGRPVHEIGLLDRDLFEEALQTVHQHGNWSRELSMTGKDGREIHVYSRWSILRDDRGNPEEILVIDGDISEQKRVESQLRRHQRVESIGTLASGIAHDLNNILMPILMLTTTLRRQTDDADDAETLDMIIHSAQRGADIVKQVLTYVRGAEGSRVLLQPQLLLKELIRLVKETFPKNLQLRQSVPSGDWLIKGSLTELNQVLLNLAVNARDAMPGGGTLRLEMEQTEIDPCFAEMNDAPRAGEYILFRVADTGSGIRPENLERIFDPFFTTKPQGEGTGLGLATVKGIVESHGGFIDVRSRTGQGSEFRVYIPAVIDASTDSRVVESAEVSQGCGQTVLVVDDEESIQKTLRRMLERSGYNVITARNGVEGISKYSAQREEIQVIISDVTMPELNGVDFVKVIKNMNPDARIIVSSGRLVEEVTEEFRALGVTEMLSKPYAAQDLLLCLDRLLAD